MPSQLGQSIRALVQANRYLIGLHASERLEQRGILEWQIIDAMENAEYLTERTDGKPHPVVEFKLRLPDGTPVKAVWAFLKVSQVAKLVTVHYLDED